MSWYEDFRGIPLSTIDEASHQPSASQTTRLSVAFVITGTMRKQRSQAVRSKSRNSTLRSAPHSGKQHFSSLPRVTDRNIGHSEVGQSKQLAPYFASVGRCFYSSCFENLVHRFHERVCMSGGNNQVPGSCEVE